jgi:putative SOS response-associated peptidase YedK
MCARYSLTKEGVTILIGEIEIILAIGARYNIAPKQKVPVIVSERGQPAAILAVGSGDWLGVMVLQSLLNLLYL